MYIKMKGASIMSNKLLASTNLIDEHTSSNDTGGKELKIYVHGFVNADGDMPVELDTNQYNLAFCDTIIGYVSVYIPAAYTYTRRELIGKAIHAAERALIATGDFSVSNTYGTIFYEKCIA